jgi:nucleoside 2-deoxyribosyltransferase
MVDFVRKRLQVFVSSTFSDLREERQAAVEAILYAGHIPAGMELFTAGDESQMEVIKQWIDESDVYLLILAGRYGSIESKTGKSYTQLEYEYALNKGKPLFACVVKEVALEARVKKHGLDMIDKHQKELETFRDLVQSRIVEFWEDSKDIRIAIANKLGHLSRREDLVGWVHGNQEANLPALSNEIARLSKENAELRNQLGAKSEVIINGLPYSQLKTLLQQKKLWDFVKRHKQSIRGGLDRRQFREVDGLSELGLMSRRQIDYENFDPTEAGVMLLNNIEFEELPPLTTVATQK